MSCSTVRPAYDRISIREHHRRRRIVMLSSTTDLGIMTSIQSQKVGSSQQREIVMDSPNLVKSFTTRAEDGRVHLGLCYSVPSRPDKIRSYVLAPHEARALARKLAESAALEEKRLG